MLGIVACVAPEALVCVFTRWDLGVEADRVGLPHPWGIVDH